MTVGKVGGKEGMDEPRRSRRSASAKRFPDLSGTQKPVPGQPERSSETRPATPPHLKPEHIRFAQNMVHAADVACVPGPTTDSDMLPRESVTGMFLRAKVVEEAEALGRGPVDRDEAVRIAIEHHTAGKSGRYYDAVIEEEGEAFVVKLHLLDPNPPFLPAETPEASYRVERTSGKIHALP